MKKLSLLLLLPAFFALASCGDDPAESEKETTVATPTGTPTETPETPADTPASTQPKATIDYTVGNKITFAGVAYYVVNNTVDSATDTDEQNLEEDIEKLLETVSVTEAKKHAAESFGEKNIILMRKKGEAEVPTEGKAEYESAYACLTADLLEGESESDYFSERSDTTDVSVSYKDFFIVLGEDKERLGNCNIAWRSNLNEAFEGEKTLFDLLKDFSTDTLWTIRNTRIGDYTICKYDKSKDASYEVEVWKFEEKSGKTRHFTSAVQDCMYMAGGKIIPSTRIVNEWDKDGNWIRTYIYPGAVYKETNTNAGIMFTVYKNGDEYTYLIHGSSHTGRPMYRVGMNEITFDENNTFTAENVVIPADADIYSEAANLRYNEDALSIPIELVKNEDGTVSFGESVMEWAKKWRDYIVETHEDATAY